MGLGMLLMTVGNKNKDPARNHKDHKRKKHSISWLEKETTHRIRAMFCLDCGVECCHCGWEFGFHYGTSAPLSLKLLQKTSNKLDLSTEVLTASLGMLK